MSKIKTFKPVTALFMAFLMLFGTIPATVFAQEETEEQAQYIYVDGERISLDDNRIQNYVSVQPQSSRFRSTSPTVSGIAALPADFARNPNVTMNGTRVSALRYVVSIDGIDYESYCADPQLRGPENSSAVYELSGEANSALRNALKNGYPINTEWSDYNIDDDDRMWWAYITRVAVAMANNADRSFAGDSVALEQAKQLADGVITADQNKYPAIMVSGTQNAQDTGRIISESVAQSQAFSVTYNRKTNLAYNPFRFEWDSSTPAGAKLVVDGTVIATAPTNPDTIFRNNINSFHIEMPNEVSFRNQSAKVNLVGIHNQFADRIWLMQNPNSPDSWQDIVFYIPAMLASAEFSFVADVMPQDSALRIVKQNPSSQGLAGAVFEIAGPDGYSERMTTPQNGIISIGDLPSGEYTITEITPPQGHKLADPASVTVTIAADGTETIEQIFVNEPTTPDPDPTPTPTPTPKPELPPTSVVIQKIDALTRGNIPGALIRLRGMSSHQVITGDGNAANDDTSNRFWEMDNTGINLSQVLTFDATTGGGDVTSTVTDGIWSLEGLPYGFYMAEEERAPHNYSLLPQHTAYGFWLLPPNVIVNAESGEFYDEAGNLIEVFDSDGNKIIPAVEYEIIEDGGVNSVLVTFENYPYGKIELEKIDEVTGRPVAGAKMRIVGYFSEGNENGIPTDRTETTDSSGKILWEDLPAGMYAITEVFAPEGYVLSEETITVPLTWGQTTSVTFKNTPKTTLEVIKVDEFDSTKTLSGAKFELKDPTTGETWEGTTDSSGKAIFGVGTGGSELIAGKTYILTEIQPPNGYIINHIPQEVVLRNTGVNTITVTNEPKVSLEVVKIDANTNSPLEGAIFTLVDRTNGETWQSTTGADGKAIFGVGSLGNELLAGKLYILTEMQAANGYILDTAPHEIILKNAGVNTYTVKNWRNPSLTIIKRDKDNGQTRLEGAVFEAVYENGQTVAGSPFTTDSNGEIIIDEILFDNTDERTLIITETIPPAGYNLSDPNWQRVTVRKGEDNVIIFENTRKPTLEIHKVDAINSKNLAGAEFTIEKLEEPGKGMLTGNPFRTDSNGKIILEYQYSGKYRIVEVQSPSNYWLDPQQQNREWILEIKDNEDYYLRVENTLLPTLIVTKWNAVTYKPVPLTHFKVEYEVPNSGNVELIGNFVTNSNGQIVLPYIRAGWYRITETKAAPGMSLAANNSYRVYLSPGDNSYMPISDVTNNNPDLNTEMPIFKDIKVFGGNDFFVAGEAKYEFPENSLVIQGESNETFTILNSDTARASRANVQIDINADVVGEFNADSSGILVIAELDEANYSVVRSDGTSEITTVKNDGGVTMVTFSAAEIEKETSNTELEPEPIPEIDENTPIEIVENETLVEQITRNITVGSGDMYYNTGEGIWNYPLNSIVIKKTDATNGRLLAGASFDLIYTSSGESGTKGTVIGRYTTNFSGIIVITGLEPGAYVVEEVSPPENYMLSVNNRQTAYLQPDGHSIVEVEFSNYPYGSLLITKRDEVTGTVLQGAEFRVQSSDGTLVGTSNGRFVTNQQGEILISNLKPDSYVVTETLAPSGYVIGDNASQTISVKPDGEVYHLNFTNKPLSSLTVRKLDSYDNSPIAGAKFRVERQNGEFIGEYETDQQGLFVVNEVLGWFKVTEIDPASGYVMDDSMKTIEVKAGTPAVLVFYNARQGGLTIEKLDQDGKPLAGAIFRVTKQNGEFIGTYTSNTSGIINVGQLDSGWVIVEETQAPSGYVISESAKSVEIKANAQAGITFVNKREATLTIRKVDESGTGLAGAKFRISEIGGGFTQELTTATGGTASLNLPDGTYEITETHAPTGYVITEATQTIKIAAGESREITFVNKKEAILTIRKIDEDGNPLVGAKFNVTQIDGGFKQEVTTATGGVVTLTIPDGSYEIVETLAPSGYVITEAARTIHIKAGENKTETFVNKRIPSLIIEKADENGNPLANAVFEVRKINGERIAEIKTNQGGTATVDSLSPDSYEVIETQAPQGYVILDGSKIIEIKAGQTATVRFVNAKQPSLIIEKFDIDGKPLQGAEFEVRKLDGGLVTRVTSNTGGTATVTELVPGSYEIIESKAPTGYVADNSSQVIEIAAGETKTIRFVNVKIAEVAIKKIDGDTREVLRGVEFEIRHLNGEIVRNPEDNSTRFITNKAGLIHLPHLSAGSYIAAETKALDGYNLAEPKSFQVADGQNITVTIENYKKRDTVIKKIDGETEEVLAGVQFEIATYVAPSAGGTQSNSVGDKLRNPLDGSYIFTTDKAGLIKLPALDSGTYIATEIKPLDGYHDAEPVVFVVGNDTPYNETQTIVIRNYKKRDTVIKKIDGDTGAALAGVQFEIAYYTGNSADDKLRNPLDGSYIFTTDTAGLIKLPALNSNTYIATEISPLGGYLNAEPVVFIVGNDTDYNDTQTITIKNYKRPEITIKKVDGDTNAILSGVVFEIRAMSGEKIRNPQTGTYEFTTDNAGLIRLPFLDAGTYTAVETKPLSGYKTTEPTDFEVKNGKNQTVLIKNFRHEAIVIQKVDGETGEVLRGVEFEIRHLNGEIVRNPVDNSARFVTDHAGLIHLPPLTAGSYVAAETKALDGYNLAEPTPFQVTDGQNITVTIENYKKRDTVIKKMDGDTEEVLTGVQFEIAYYIGNAVSDKLRNPVDGSCIFTTDNAGLIKLPALDNGTYIATEIKPLEGYLNTDPVIFTVGNDIDYNDIQTITIRNYKRPEITIKKVDGETGEILQGVEFEIRHLNGEIVRNTADNSNRFITNNAGLIHLPNLEAGSYVATETKSLASYYAAAPTSFQVVNGQNITVTIENYKKRDTVIKKIDGETEEVLAGVQFEIALYSGNSASDKLRNPVDGSYIFTTDNAGLIKLPALDDGTYIAAEIKPLDGYHNTEPTIFTVGNDIDYNDTQTVIIRNYKKSDTVIKKIDGDTGTVLAGVQFEIALYSGDSTSDKLRNPIDGSYIFTTDTAGLIKLPALDNGTYIATEIKPLDGYLNAEPRIFTVGNDVPYSDMQTIIIENYRQAELTIKKINSETREPLQGVVFQITRPNGEKLVNPKTGFHDFTTDRNGLIYLSAIEDGNYWLTETKALDGFIANPEPMLLTIDSSTRQREHLLVVENTPASGLLIIKTDAQTGEALAGVIFEVRHADGRIVQGNILDSNQPNTEHNSPQLNENNGFTTNNRGRITLNHLAPGVYHVVEIKQLAGYELDTTVHVVTVEPGKQAVLRVENTPLSGLRIYKTDAITGEPIFGVEFMLFDQNGKVVGNFYSDNRGIVEFPALLTAGRYTIRETRPANGYAADDMPRTVDFVPGRVTEIDWTNMPMGGQLQISKVSGDYNEQNGLPAGTQLSGAIFEIYSYRTGNLVDRIISDHRGMAVSKPLPLGRYYAIEVSAPAYYKINPQKIDFDIEFDRQIVKFTFSNYSANIGVTIDKTGPREAMQGHNIVYDIKTVRNDSTIPLTDFFWRDILPTNAVRADKLVTGTYNQSLRYKVLGKTNKGNEIVIADNLSTMQNNVVELKPVHFGLASDEYITEFTLYFGQVPAGFTAVDKPKVYVDVLPSTHTFLPNNMMFANKVDIGGKVAGSNEWVISNSTTATTIYNPTTNKIPQSGY